MLKIRLMGTRRDISWFQRIIQRYLSYPIHPICLPSAGLLFICQRGDSRVVERSEFMGSLSKYEQETIIKFNTGEQSATVYTRDKAVMRKLDVLVIEFPEIYKLVEETDIDKTYSMPKSCVNYRKPRRISEELKEQRRKMMKGINKNSK